MTRRRPTSSTVEPGEALAWARLHWRASDEAGARPNPLRTVPRPDPDRDRLRLAPIELTGGGVVARARELHRPGSVPVIVRGAAAAWPATRTWTLDHFAASYGDHEVPVDDGTVSLRRCVAGIRAGDGGYARFSPLLHDHPELVEALDLETLFQMSGSSRRRTLFQLFLGAAGSRTETHCAIGNNAFVQVHGEKRWLFVAPAYSAALRPIPLGRPYLASRADLDNPDRLDSDVPVFEVVLGAGDVLLIPPFWWHQVDNPTESIGVASRWHHIAHALAQSRFFTAMTLTARRPNIVRAAAERRRFGYVYRETIDQVTRIEQLAAGRSS